MSYNRETIRVIVVLKRQRNELRHHRDDDVIRSSEADKSNAHDHEGRRPLDLLIRLVCGLICVSQNIRYYRGRG
jgi:hypothetical protein